MNNLSWFIYLADVVQGVKPLLIVPSIIGLVTIAVWIICIASENSERRPYKGMESIEYPKFWIFTVIIISLFNFTLASFIPSKETIYLIAGSEAGEMVVKSPEAQEILSDVKEVLKGQLESLKPKKD